jgi:hypothetical protein
MSRRVDDRWLALSPRRLAFAIVAAMDRREFLRLTGIGMGTLVVLR